MFCTAPTRTYFIWTQQSARMNAEELEETGVYYALSVGVNPLGGPSTPGVLAKMQMPHPAFKMRSWQVRLSTTHTPTR